MNNTITLGTWNIEGAIRFNDLSTLGDFLAELNDLDVLCLQEFPFGPNNEDDHLLDQLSRAIGLPYYVGFPLSASHLNHETAYHNDDMYLGLALLSKSPITHHSCTFLPNPRWQITRENGNVWHTHDKGVLIARINQGSLGNKEFAIACVHLVPFTEFKKAPTMEEYKPVWSKLVSLLAKDPSVSFILGDFNCEIPLKLFGSAPERHYEDAIIISTHKKGAIDHIIYSSVRNSMLNVACIKTNYSDHAFCKAEFATRNDRCIIPHK